MTGTIKRLLGRLAGRERSLGFAWAAGRAVAVVLAVFVICCAVDWLLDRFGETPWSVRAALLGVQAVLWLGALLFIVWPLMQRFKEDDLALRVEEAVPSLGHRLISAVQFNREGAKTRGMSKELIAATTAQAERQAERVDISEVVPGGRYVWGMVAGLPGVLIVGILFAVMPATAWALAQRAFLGDAEIPRRVNLSPAMPPVWPSNEEGEIRVSATGDTEGDEGHVIVWPDKGESMRLPLSKSGEHWTAKLPPSDVAFSWRAWIGDGRMKGSERVEYSPRPVAQSVVAVVRLPLSLAKKDDGSHYEEPQKAGDIVWRVKGSTAWVTVQVQTPVTRCTLVARTPKRETTHELEVTKEGEKKGLEAKGEFPMDGIENGSYEVLTETKHGFKNVERTRRSIRYMKADPPEVALLPEIPPGRDPKSATEEDDLDGIPVVEGQRFRLDYRAASRYGLARARMRFAVVPLEKGDEGQDKIDPDSFQILTLGPAKREFATSKASPEALPDSEAMGAYDFALGGISDGKKGLLKLKKGDRVRFYIEVFGKADPDGKPGRSAMREKEVVEAKDLFDWLARKEDLKEKTRLLEEAARTTRPGAP